MARLLLRGTEGHDHGAHHRQAERHLPWRTRHEALFLENGALACVPTGTAIFLRPSWRAPTAAMQNLLPGDIVLTLDPPKLQDGIADVRWQMALDKGAHLGAEGQ